MVRRFAFAVALEEQIRPPSVLLRVLRAFSRCTPGSLVLAASFVCALGAQTAEAGPILPGFNGATLASTDDGSTGPVAIGFPITFFSANPITTLFVNNNGNVTFNSSFGDSVPGLPTSPLPMIAPFFADVDTRDVGQTTPDVTYGPGTVNGRPAFGVNWIGVDYYQTDPSHTNRNSFQLLFVQRADTGPNNFDFWFNYDQIQWETGEAGGGSPQGCGGGSAQAGYTNGGAIDFELPGSGVNGAFLDSGTCLGATPGPNALILGRANSSVPGRFIFPVRNGVVQPPTIVQEPPPVPEPASLSLLGLGLAGLGTRRWRQRART